MMSGLFAMNLTIAELAVAVDRSETYVRQHLHRKHLAAIKEGPRVYVDPNEAQRWARERGLPFRPPVRTDTVTTPIANRTARMTVLAWSAPDGQLWNLFTLVRHRRKNGMGPWWCEPSIGWQIEELSGDLHLLSCDMSWECCEPIIAQVLVHSILEAEGVEVRYHLEPTPRHHWAYRDKRGTPDQSLRSPFARHSAEVLEYWSFDAELRTHWRTILEPSLQGRSRLTRLGFPLDLRSDRVGNLMIARAEDATTFDLQAHHRDRTLTFIVEADDCTPDSYRGVVWASHSDDDVFRQQVAVATGETLIELESDIDSIGFEVFRVIDSQCIDLMSHHLVMDVVGNLNVQMGPTLHLRQDRGYKVVHQVNPFHHSSTLRVRADTQSPELDRQIRQQRLDYLSYQRESSVQTRSNLYRFNPGEQKQAAKAFLGILTADIEPPSPIYFADPYFMDSARDPAEIRFWLDIFAATSDAPLHILCGKNGEDSGLPQWWLSCPKPITSHVGARIFTKHDGDRPRSAFHDRYLITPRNEILITHSVNGWASDGVTFVNLPYGIYRAEAEKLWSIDVESSTDGIHVEELC